FSLGRPGLADWSSSLETQRSRPYRTMGCKATLLARLGVSYSCSVSRNPIYPCASSSAIYPQSLWGTDCNPRLFHGLFAIEDGCSEGGRRRAQGRRTLDPQSW